MNRPKRDASQDTRYERGRHMWDEDKGKTGKRANGKKEKGQNPKPRDKGKKVKR